jgi:hypothetical protein
MPRAYETGHRSSYSTTGGALPMIVAASAAPYGYTVSLWSTGAVLVHFHSAPTIAEIFLFAAGALGGYSLLGLLAGRKPGTLSSSPVGSQRLMFGMLHWFGVGIAVGSACLLAQIPGWVAWPLGSLAATTLYLTGAAAELALLTRAQSGRPPDQYAGPASLD